ncbi:BTAD domain-containing putative transcriptional regulator [Microbacterium sp. W4I4]|uniref:AfsR/SARP family transcriptional regulator n=1 Tax=Microbacterium sp. W4I4 TaxID=3042295 RepID=UPI0027D919A8|nr:BTAD domain-containing putative transcriptional regulator [Microbacterium sp. W4I4]
MARTGGAHRGKFRIEVLGAVRVRADGKDVTPPGRLQRLLVAALAARPGGLPASELCMALWQDSSQAARLHLLVHRTRTAIGSVDLIERTDEGYRLAVASDAIDVRTLESDVPGAPAKVLELLQGEPYAGCEGAFFEEVRAETESTVLGARRCALERAAAGGDDELVLRWVGAAREKSPYDEQLAAVHISSLARIGRVGEALAEYEVLRRRLADELGADPGPSLQALHLRIVSGIVENARPNQQPPAQPTLIGRESALAALDGLGPRNPLAIVSGTGGVGKTALAVAWATKERDRFRDGILHADLGGYGIGAPAEPQAILARFLRTLASPVPHGADTSELASHFRAATDRRRLLVVLDNVRSEAQVRPLLPAGDGPVAIITGREQMLGLGAQFPALSVQLMPLSPDAGAQVARSQCASLDEVAARRLAERCAGLPLAIAVAARAVAAGVHREIVDDADRAGGMLEMLETGDAASDVATVLSWSLEDLDPVARRMFRLLGLVSEPLTRPAIIALAGGDPAAARTAVRRLERANLLIRSTAGRLTMHDLLRELAAREWLAGEVPAIAEVVTTLPEGP